MRKCCMKIYCSNMRRKKMIMQCWMILQKMIFQPFLMMCNNSNNKVRTKCRTSCSVEPPIHSTFGGIKRHPVKSSEKYTQNGRFDQSNSMNWKGILHLRNFVGDFEEIIILSSFPTTTLENEKFDVLHTSTQKNKLVKEMQFSNKNT